MEEFFHLYKAEEPKLRSFTQQFFNGRIEDANDALQNALISAYIRYPAIKEELENFPAWIFRITKNACIGMLRKRRSQCRKSVLEIVISVNNVYSNPVYDDLAGLVKTLPKIYKDVVVLRFWDDMKVKDIADSLGIPLGTVKSRLNHALALLRQKVNATSQEDTISC